MNTTRTALTEDTATIGTRVHKGNGAAVFIIRTVTVSAIWNETVVKLSREGKTTTGGLEYRLHTLTLA